jgi:hypothetical protein
MGNKEKGAIESFMGTWEGFSDKFVAIFYNESLVKSIENLDFMKKLMNSSFIKALQDFWKGWFKQVFIFLWYLAIIFWLISIVLYILDLFDSFRYFRWMISIILSISMSFLSVITWFWMIKFKKRFPFMALISYIGQIIVYVVFNPYGHMYYSRGSSIGYIIFSFLFFIIWYALILKNKDLFKN